MFKDLEEKANFFEHSSKIMKYIGLYEDKEGTDE